MGWVIFAAVMGMVIVLLCWAVVRVGHSMRRPQMEASEDS